MYDMKMKNSRPPLRDVSRLLVLLGVSAPLVLNLLYKLQSTAQPYEYDF